MQEKPLVESIAGDYRGIMWDLGEYFLPGSMLSIGLLFLFPTITSHFLEILGNNTLLFLSLFILASYCLGQALDAARENIQRLGKRKFYSKYLSKALENSLYYQAIQVCVFRGEEEFQKMSPPEIYRLLAKYVRMHNIDIYNFYFAREVYINELRLNLGVAFFVLGSVAIYVKVHFFTSAVSFSLINLLFLISAILIYNGLREHPRRVFAIVEAVYTICSPTNKKADKKHEVYNK